MITIFKSIPKEYPALLKDLIKESLKENAYFSWALSGGNTPIHLYKELALNYKTAIDWQKVKIFWGDERCVAPDHEDSNYYHAYKHLLCHVDIPRENIFRMKGEEDPQLESARYAEVLTDNLRMIKDIPTFDLNMLGIGPDGHTASIFPGQESLLRSEKWCEVGIHPQSGQNRITLTGPIINASDLVHIIASGQSKSKIIKEILDGKDSYPAGSLKPKNGISWILDKESSAILQKN